jgi:hypothetical protein
MTMGLILLSIKPTLWFDCKEHFFFIFMVLTALASAGQKYPGKMLYSSANN